MKVYELDDPEVAHARNRPLPTPDNTSGPFWAAAARGELVVQRCLTCGRHQFYPRPMCTGCAGPVEWVATSERGSIYTYTVIRQNLAEPFGDLRPYVVALVALDEGPVMMSNVTDLDPDRVEIGTPVECYAVRVADEIAIPFWRPAGR